MITTYQELDRIMDMGEPLEILGLNLGCKTITAPYVSAVECYGNGRATIETPELDLKDSHLEWIRTTAKSIRIYNSHIGNLEAPIAESILVVDSYIGQVAAVSPKLAMVNAYVGRMSGTPTVHGQVNSYVHIEATDNVALEVV